LGRDEVEPLREGFNSVPAVLFEFGDAMVDASADFRLSKLGGCSAGDKLLSDLTMLEPDFEGDLVKPNFSSLPLKLGVGGETGSAMMNE